MNIEDAADEYFQHFGVPGMKWGVRKKSSRTPSEDARRHGAARRKHPSELSDKELKDLVNRMNMEQQVKRLNPSTVAKGHNALKATAALAGTIAAVAAFTNSRPGRYLEESLKRKTRIPVGSIGRTIGRTAG